MAGRERRMCMHLIDNHGVFSLHTTTSADGHIRAALLKKAARQTMES